MKYWTTTLLFITFCPFFAHAATASKKGTPIDVHNRIVFARVDGIWTIKPDGTGQRRVWKVPKGYGAFGGFRSDGRKAITFGNFNVYEHDLVNRKIRKVAVWNGGWGTYIGQSTYSRDEKFLLSTVGSSSANSLESSVFRSPLGKSVNLYDFKYSVAPRGPDVPPNLNWYRLTDFPDTRHLLVEGGISSLAVEINADSETDLWIMDNDGTNPRRLTQGPEFDRQPAVSPDGLKVLYVRDYVSPHKPRPWETFINYDTLDYELRQIDLSTGADTPFGVREANLPLLPRSDPDIDPKTGEPIPQSPPPHLTGLRAGGPHFSPDGKSVLFVEKEIDICDLKGEGAHKLCDGGFVQWVR